MPQISVIVPVYNTARYLEECLNSLCAQTFQDFELICIDDGSTDESPRILEKFAKKYPFIRVLTQTNQGISAARNAGLKAAKGKWIAFVDSDDWVEPNFLEYLYGMATRYDAEVAQCRLIKYEGKPSMTSRVKLVSDPLKRIKVRFSVYTKLYRADFIRGFYFIEGISFEDYPWVIPLLTRVKRMAISEARLYHYRMNPTSITKSAFTPQKVRDYWTGLQHIFAYFSEHQLPTCYLCRKLVPNLLKSQLKLIQKEKEQVPLLSVFAQELRWVKENKLFSVWDHSWRRLWTYHQIMRRYGNF